MMLGQEILLLLLFFSFCLFLTSKLAWKQLLFILCAHQWGASSLIMDYSCAEFRKEAAGIIEIFFG